MKIFKTRIDRSKVQWIRIQLYDFEQDRMLFDFEAEEHNLNELKKHFNEHVDKYLKENKLNGN